MQFRYIATQLNGEIVENNIDANDTAEVLQFLASRNLKPVSVRAIGRGLEGISSGFLRGKIDITDQIFLSKYLSLLLHLGTGLLQAINILVDDFEKLAMKNFLLEIRAALERGQPFYMSFSRYPKVFGQVYINLVKAGEASGNLDMVFENLTNVLTKQKALRDQIKGALIYPILLLSMSFLILFFLITFALPKISKVFSESGFDPPAFSKMVFAIGGFFEQFGIYLFIVFVIGLVAFVYSFKHVLIFRKLVMSVVSDISVIREVVKKTAIQRFAHTLSLLVKAGIPITEALEITAGVVANPQLKEALMRISKEGLAKGLTIGESFRKEPFFPKMVISLMTISEKSGNIDKILMTLSEFYIQEIDTSLKMLISFLEPILLLFIGGIIGLIALSVILPIYQLTTQF